MLFLRVITLVMAMGVVECLAASPEALKHSFSVSRTLKAGGVPNGPGAMRKLFKKFGWKIPSSSAKLSNVVHFAGNLTSLGMNETGKVPAVPAKLHSEYLSPVSIGGQTLNLVFDTGSSDLWVFSTYIDRRETSGHVTYDPVESATYQNATNQTWAISYGDGSGAFGVMGYDTVNIGGAAVAHQAVELATEVTAQFERDLNCDGTLGLGFSRINTVHPDRQRTWFQNIKHKLHLPVFTANLNEDGTGSYDFGFLDSSNVAGNLTYVPVDPTNGFWEFPSPGHAVGGVPIYRSQASTAIADTGTSLMIVDDQVASHYYSRVQGAKYSSYYGGWLFPCQTAAILPSFGVSMGSNDFFVTIPANLLNYGQIAGSYCFGGVQGNHGNGMQIYGDTLFRSAFVAFFDFRGENTTESFVGLGVGPKA